MTREARTGSKTGRRRPCRQERQPRQEGCLWQGGTPRKRQGRSHGAGREGGDRARAAEHPQAIQRTKRTRVKGIAVGEYLRWSRRGHVRIVRRDLGRPTRRPRRTGALETRQNFLTPPSAAAKPRRD